MDQEVGDVGQDGGRNKGEEIQGLKATSTKINNNLIQYVYHNVDYISLYTTK